MKRLGIFCFYDKDGIVDEFITYLLEDLLENLSHLCIVCNGKLNSDGRKLLEKYTSDIYMRDNTGFDGGAYKDVLENHITFENLKDYDELLLINNSFYGPIFPFKETFKSMENKNCDFWGLLNFGELYGDMNFIKEHIQSYFLVFRKNIIVSNIFKDFWINLKNIKSFSNAIIYFEIGITQHLLNNNFSYDVLIDVIELQKKYKSNEILNWSITKSGELIEKYRLPIIKRKALNDNTFKKHYILDKQGKNILEYIHTETDYNVYLIWAHLIRILNSRQLYKKLALHYTLSNEYNKSLSIKEKVGIFIYLSHEYLLDDYFIYINKIPEYIDTYIFISDNNIYNLIKKMNLNNNIKEIILLKNSNKNNNSLFLLAKDYIKKYDIFCFLEDNIDSLNSSTINEDVLIHNLWGNMIDNKYYIENVLNIFAENKKIGLLTSSYPENRKINIDFWSEEVSLKTKDLCNNLDIATNTLDFKYKPLSLESSLWCRKEALSQLLDYTYNLKSLENNILNYSLSFISQHNGYATAVIENIKNINFKLVHSNLEILNTQLKTDLKDYMKKYNSCYLYGCGQYAKEITYYLYDMNIEIDGYIVSSSSNKLDRFLSKPVYTIDSIYESDKNINTKGIIITTVGIFNIDQISKELEKRNINHYFQITT